MLSILAHKQKIRYRFLTRLPPKPQLETHLMESSHAFVTHGRLKSPFPLEVD